MISYVYEYIYMSTSVTYTITLPNLQYFNDTISYFTTNYYINNNIYSQVNFNYSKYS